MLCDYIRVVLDKKVKLVEVPIHDNMTYRLIYWMLGSGLAKKFPKIFQWLQVLNRWIFQTTSLVSLEHEYDYIVFDRWSLSTISYGVAEGLGREFLDRLYRLQRRPDFTVVLLGSSHEHVAEDVYERDSQLQEKTRSVYSEWCRENSKESCNVNCNGTKKEVFDRVIESLKNFI
jgi:thymidylate kinase